MTHGSRAYRVSALSRVEGEGGLELVVTDGQVITASNSKRFDAPLLLPGPCPLYVRNHCRASTHGDTT